MTQQRISDVEVFTQDFCGPCKLVEGFLTERQIPFVIRNVDRDSEALKVLIERGYMSTPVIRIGETWVAGFNRKQLERLILP